MLLKILLLIFIVYLSKYLITNILSFRKKNDFKKEHSKNNIIDVEYEDIE